MKSYYSVLLCIVASIAAATATDYCSEHICRRGQKHVACGHNGQFDSTCPSDAKMVPITDSLKKVIVKAHNTKRNFIAGGGDPKHKRACRMATMKWDDELAKIAAFNVKQCRMRHDQCRNTEAFKFAGQNLAYNMFRDAAFNFNQAVEMWYSEVENSTQSIIDKYPQKYSGPMIGHFTVMMADRNTRVGCAASTYTHTEGRYDYNLFLVACNYATTNMIEFPIYAKCSKAATSCKTGKHRRYPNLCSPSEKYDVNKWY